MRTITNASNPMPNYIYMPLPDGRADVFIYKPINETEDSYEYETNEFRTSKLTKSDIASDPFKYLDYEEKEKGFAERISELESKTSLVVEITREDFDLLDVEDDVVYHIIEEDGTTTIKKGVNV